jgi:hypothetical protein
MVPHVSVILTFLNYLCTCNPDEQKPNQTAPTSEKQEYDLRNYITKAASPYKGPSYTWLTNDCFIALHPINKNVKLSLPQTQHVGAKKIELHAF